MADPAPTRRWYQFRLRTLLVVTALVCLALGWKMNQVQQQRRAVEAILAHGGIVLYDYQMDSNGNPVRNTVPPGPAWFNKLAGDDFFAHVVLVGANSAHFTDASPVASLPHLKYLHLYQTGVTDLTPLAELRELEKLNLQEMPIRDLSPLANLTSLEWITLLSCQVTDLSPLATLPMLSILEINGTPASDEQIEKLQQALPGLTIFQ